MFNLNLKLIPITWLGGSIYTNLNILLATVLIALVNNTTAPYVTNNMVTSTNLSPRLGAAHWVLYRPNHDAAMHVTTMTQYSSNSTPSQRWSIADYLNASWLHVALIGIAQCGYLRRTLGVYLKTQNYPILSKSMSSTNISHFLFFPLSAWGKNYHSSLVCPMTYRILGHIRPFCVLASRLVREQENAVVTFMVAPDMLEKTRIEVSRQFLDKSSDSVDAIQRIR